MYIYKIILTLNLPDTQGREGYGTRCIMVHTSVVKSLDIGKILHHIAISEDFHKFMSVLGWESYKPCTFCCSSFVLWWFMFEGRSGQKFLVKSKTVWVSSKQTICSSNVFLWLLYVLPIPLLEFDKLTYICWRVQVMRVKISHIYIYIRQQVKL